MQSGYVGENSDPPQRRARAVFLALFGLALPLALWLATGFHVDEGLQQLLPLVVAMYAVIRLTGAIGAQHSQLMYRTFWIFVYVFVGLGGLVQVSTAEYPFLVSAQVHPYVVEAYVAILVGLLAFDLGSSRDPSSSVSRRTSSDHVSIRALVILAGMAAAGSLYIIVSAGGLELLAQSRSEFNTAVASVATLPLNPAIFGLLFRVPLPIIFLYALHLAYRGDRRRWLSRAHVLLTVTTGVLSVIVANPISGPRFWFGTISVAAIFIVWPWLPGRRAAYQTGAIIIAILLAFPVAAAYRHPGDPGITQRLQAFSLTAELGESGDFGVASQVIAAASYVDHVGHSKGTQSLGIVLFWIPRAFWPDKPDATGPLVARFHGSPIDNVAMPLWGFLFIEFGLPAVALGFVGYGLGTRKLDQVYERSAAGSLWKAFVPVAAGYQFFILRGDPLPAVAFFALVVAVFVALALLPARKSQSDWPLLMRPPLRNLSDRSIAGG